VICTTYPHHGPMRQLSVPMVLQPVFVCDACLQLNQHLPASWGWYGDWVCDDCKRPQLGDKPYGEDRFRCVACGPGDGLAPCPASHTNKKACPLCRGAGYVEAL
jgi:hypothetical protein